MHTEHGSNDISNVPVGAGGPQDERPRLSRRQALGTISAAATAGAVAWVVPEILAAKPAAAAMSSPGGDPDGDGDHDGNGRGDGDGDGGGRNHGANASAAAPTAGAGLAVVSPSSMAPFSGHGIVRDAESGAAMVAGGWIFHRWVSRSATGATGAAAASGDEARLDGVDPV